jgi:hypothetical protein
MPRMSRGMQQQAAHVRVRHAPLARLCCKAAEGHRWILALHQLPLLLLHPHPAASASSRHQRHNQHPTTRKRRDTSSAEYDRRLPSAAGYLNKTRSSALADGVLSPK